MSVHLSSRVWESADVKGSDLLVLLYLADTAGHDGYAWPSVKRIAQHCRLKERQTQTILKRLVENGHLTVDRPGRGSGITTRYRVMYFDPQYENEKVRSTAPLKKNEKVHSSTEKVHSSAPKGAAHRTLTVNEPSQEPPIGVKAQPAAKPAREKAIKASPLADDFQPSDTTLQWAFKDGFVAEEVDAERDKFVDYHMAKGDRMVDWQRSFKNWMRNSRTFNTRKPTQAPPNGVMIRDKRGNLTGAGLRLFAEELRSKGQ